MNRRQQWAVRAVLVVVAGVLAWQLATEWKQADLRYEVLASPAEQSEAAAAGGTREEPAPAEGIAEKNVFSADRNNLIPEPEVEETEVPPRPIVLGTMKLGENYEALMAEDESSRDKVRRVKQGEQIGAYRVTEIQDSSVAVEYKGQTTKLEIYQSRSTAAGERPRTAVRPAPPAVVSTGAAPARTPTSTPAQGSASSQPSPPAQRGREIKPPGLAPYTRVFVEGNQRRVERETPFGMQVWYEPLQPGDTQ